MNPRQYGKYGALVLLAIGGLGVLAACAAAGSSERGNDQVP
jgi:hypothetical protein